MRSKNREIFGVLFCFVFVFFAFFFFFLLFFFFFGGDGRGLGDGGGIPHCYNGTTHPPPPHSRVLSPLPRSPDLIRNGISASYGMEFRPHTEWNDPALLMVWSLVS